MKRLWQSCLQAQIFDIYFGRLSFVKCYTGTRILDGIPGRHMENLFVSWTFSLNMFKTQQGEQISKHAVLKPIFKPGSCTIERMLNSMNYFHHIKCLCNWLALWLFSSCLCDQFYSKKTCADLGTFHVFSLIKQYIILEYKINGENSNQWIWHWRNNEKKVDHWCELFLCSQVCWHLVLWRRIIQAECMFCIVKLNIHPSFIDVLFV